MEWNKIIARALIVCVLVIALMAIVQINTAYAVGCPPCDTDCDCGYCGLHPDVCINFVCCIGQYHTTCGAYCGL